MTEANKSLARVATVDRALAGPAPKSASAFLARQRPILTARWVRSCRRALRYLNDPDVKIDGTWVKLFNSMSDRVGYPRHVEQSSSSLSVSTTVAAEDVRRLAEEMLQEVPVDDGLVEQAP